MRRVRRDLAAAADAERASQQQRYMRSALPFFGVPMPGVRRIVRVALREHPLADSDDLAGTALTMWDEATRREEWYAALAVVRAPAHRSWRGPQLMWLYDHLVVTGRWWDVVDEVATHLVAEALAADPVQVGRVMRRWASGEDQWRRRAALVCQVGAKGQTDQALLRDVIVANLAEADFFLRKGIGWALRDYSRTDPRWVRAFVAEHDGDLSALSRREATKYL